MQVAVGQRLGGRAVVPGRHTRQISKRTTGVVRSQERKRPEYIPNRWATEDCCQYWCPNNLYVVKVSWGYWFIVS